MLVNKPIFAALYQHQPTQPVVKDKTRDVDIVEQLDPSLGIGFGPKLISQKVGLIFCHSTIL
jgi:hypothetical protein